MATTKRHKHALCSLNGLCLFGSQNMWLLQSP